MRAAFDPCHRLRTDPMRTGTPWRQFLPGIALAASLLAVAASARIPPEPSFTLRCEITGAPPVLVRVQPASASVVLLDPASGSEQALLRTSEPASQIPAGVLDEVRAEIDDSIVRWSVTTYRPMAGSDSVRIDLRTLVYRGEGWGGTRDHADVEVTLGQCSRLGHSSP